MQDCLEEEQNENRDERKGKAEHCESTGEGNKGDRRGKIVIMKTSA